MISPADHAARVAATALISTKSDGRANAATPRMVQAGDVFPDVAVLDFAEHLEQLVDIDVIADQLDKIHADCGPKPFAASITFDVPSPLSLP